MMVQAISVEAKSEYDASKSQKVKSQIAFDRLTNTYHFNRQQKHIHVKLMTFFHGGRWMYVGR